MTIDTLKYIIGGNDYKINKSLLVHNPKVGEILVFGEQKYFQVLNTFVSRPYDAMVSLWDLGIDYQEINNFTLFLWMCKGLSKDLCSIFFPTQNIDLSAFELMQKDDGSVCLYSGLNNEDIVIDDCIFTEISMFLRKIHYIDPKPEYDPGNMMAKKRLIEKMRRKENKQKKEGFTSQLSNMISLIVNSGLNNYTYDSIQNITVSQLFDSYYRINKVDNYKNIMTGLYHGMVDSEKINLESISWATNILEE